MPLTEELIAIRAFNQAVQRGGQPDATFIPRAIAQVPDALSRLSKRIAAGLDWYNAQEEFELVAAAGRVDLSPANDLADTILFNPHRSSVFVGNSDAPAMYVEQLETLKDGELPNDTYYFTHRGQQLIFLNLDGATNTLAGPVKIVANFVWAIAEVPPEFEKELLDILAEISAPSPHAVAINAASAAEGVEVGRA